MKEMSGLIENRLNLRKSIFSPFIPVIGKVLFELLSCSQVNF